MGSIEAGKIGVDLDGKHGLSPIVLLSLLSPATEMGDPLKTRFMITPLTEANLQLRAGKYSEAIKQYRIVLKKHPELGRFVQFNIDLAEKRLGKSHSHGIHQESKHHITQEWVTHESLQSPSDYPSIVIGAMVIGYLQPDTTTIASRVFGCAQLFTQIAQIPDWHTLRLRAENELQRLSYSASDVSQVDYIHAFVDDVIQIGSIWYSNSRDLIIRVDKNNPFNDSRVFRAYQYDPVVDGGLALVGESLVQEGDWQLVSVALVNPYLPIFLTLASPEGYLIDASLIPYPSLLPGGIHEHECYLDHDDSKSASKLLAQALLPEHLRALDRQHGWALGQIQLDIREAIGSEIILSTDFKEWLWSLFSLRIKPWNPPELPQPLSEYWQEVFTTPSLMRTAEKFSTQTAREREGRTLLCPPRAIPSLRALTASRASGTLEQCCGLSEFILIQERPFVQRARLSWPEASLNEKRALAQDGAIHIPMVLVDKDSKQSLGHPTGVSALLFAEPPNANSAQLIMPIAPDYAEVASQPHASRVVSIVITADTMPLAIFAGLLESLSLQRHANIRHIVCILPSSGQHEAFETYLQQYFPGRYLLLPARENEPYRQRIQRATASLGKQADEAYMLFINQPMLLHDSRTLTSLAQALTTPKAVTASVRLIGKVEMKSKPEIGIRFGGVFPVREQGQSEYRWYTADLGTAIPRTTLPVASHGDAIFMIKAIEWKKSGGMGNVKTPDEHAAYEYAAKLLANNKLHLLIPHVTAELQLTERIGNSQASSPWQPNPDASQPMNAVRIAVLPS